MRQDAPQGERDDAPPGSAAVDKALALLDRIATARRPPTAAKLQHDSGLPRSTLHRLLAVLESHGLARRDPLDRTWRPGLRLIDYANAAWSGFDVREAAEAELEPLSDSAGETVQLAILDGDAAIVVAGAAGPQPIARAHSLGLRTPWSRSAAGLALVAFGAADTRERRVAALPTDEREAADAAIGLARGRGYAIGVEDDGEVATLAAPILDPRGDAAAALSLTGPRFRLGDRALHALAPLLMSAARRISHNAGGNAMSLATGSRPGAPSRDVRCVDEAGALLGEAPYWSAREQALVWVDMLQPALHRLRVPARGSMQRDARPLERLTSAAIPRRNGGLVLAQPTGLALHAADGRFERWLARPPAAHAGHRYNDAKCDAAGRLWIGMMDPAGRAGRGTLWRVDPSGAATRIDEGFAVPNGLATSPDGRTLYFADSGQRAIFAYALDPRSGEARERRVLATFDEDVKPDGLATDRDGGLWVAVWDGWRVERYDAQGRRTRSVRLPVPRPTSVAFGGPTLSTLFVTSARARLDAEALADAPLSGGLFAFEPAVPGLAVAPFAG